MTRKEKVYVALRDLVATIYTDCKGAYGDECGYNGQYDELIFKLTELLAKDPP